jgi:hypothetical protein
MVANKNQHQGNRHQSAHQDHTTNQKNPQPKAHPKPVQPKEDLKSALAKVVEKTTPAQKPAPQAERTAVTSTTPTQSPAAAQPTAPAAQPSPTLYKQSAEPTVGGVRQPAFTPHEQAAGPDINVAKKILRHSGKERPPGT